MSLLARLAAGVAAAVWLLAPGLASRLGAQTQTIRTGIAVVPVDVRVVDKQGKPVVGLTRDDFVVTENGVVQAVTFFEERRFDTASTVAGPRVLLPHSQSPDALPTQKRRVFLIALERIWLPTVPFSGMQALTRFLRDRLGPNDYAAVSAFGRMTDLTNDHEALAIVIERLRAMQQSMIDRNVALTERIALFELANNPTIATAEPVRRAIDAVFAPASAGIHGAPRHNGEFEAVVARIGDEMWAAMSRASRGFGGMSSQVAQAVAEGGGGTGSDKVRAETSGPRPSLHDLIQAVERRAANVLGAIQYLKFIDGERHLIYPFVGPTFLSYESDEAIARTASDARVAITFIKADGMKPYSGRAGVSTPSDWESMNTQMSFKSVAGISGGQVFLDRDPDESYASIDETSRSSYLLAYSPANSTLDGKYREIKVRLKDVKGATLINRQRYRASAASEAFDAEQYAARDRMLTAASWPGGLRDLGVTLSAGTKGASVIANVRADFRQVTSELVGDRHVSKLELAVFVTNPKGETIGSAWQTLDLSLQSDTFARMQQEGFARSFTIPVTDRVRYVKVVVYDYKTGRAGSAVVRLD